MRARRIPGGLTFPLICFLLMWVMTVHPQEPGELEDQREHRDELGLANPAPSGLSVLYMFTGVANESAGNSRFATSVHCANLGPDTVQAEFQFFDHSATNAYSITRSVAPNQTVTISTQNTHYREDGFVSAGTIVQGSGRVLADPPTLICTAQVLSPYEATGHYSRTVFMAQLPLFDRNGSPVGSQRKVHLPIVLRDS